MEKKMFMIITDHHGFTFEESLREEFFTGFDSMIVIAIKLFEEKAEVGEFVELRMEESKDPFMAIVRVTTHPQDFVVFPKLHAS